MANIDLHFLKNLIQSPLIILEAELTLDFLSPFEDGAFRNTIYFSQIKGGKTCNIDVNNNNNFILLDQENISKINDGLREMIDKSTLSSCNKRRLKQILSKKDKIKSINISIFHDIQSERQEVLNKCLIKLEKLGILYKKHDGIV